MESLQHALSHGIAVAARISYTIFKSAVLKALFIIDEDHLEMAIEQDADLLPLFLIYAPHWVKHTQQLASRAGRSFEHKITMESTLKWLKEECERRHVRYYDIIVNVPKEEPDENIENSATEVSNVDRTTAEVYPPPGADMKRVMWFWNNVQRLTGFIFRGVMPESSKKYAIMHLRWLKEQEKQGRTKIGELLEEAQKQNKAQKKERKQN